MGSAEGGVTSACFTPAFSSPANSSQRAGPESLDCPDEPRLGPPQCPGLRSPFKIQCRVFFFFPHSACAVSCLLHPCGSACCWGRKQLFCEENINGESALVFIYFHIMLLIWNFLFVCFCNLSCWGQLVSTQQKLIFRPNCLNAQEENGIPHTREKETRVICQVSGSDGEVKCQPIGPNHDLG